MLLASLLATAFADPEVIVAWGPGGADYQWPSPKQRASYLATEDYIPRKNNIAGLKVDPRSTRNETTLYVSIPRWLSGVPSTLNKLVVNLDQEGRLRNPKLEPWPTWELQAQGNCNAIQYVQSMEIDNNGHMWVIDVGTVNVFEADPAMVDHTCPPKLLVIDTVTGKMVDEPYIFPNEVVNYNVSLLNDIVIDNQKNVAYISNTLGAGAVVMYDRTARKSYTFSDKSMGANLAFHWEIGGHYFRKAPWAGAAVDGIALSPDGKYLYYSALTDATLYMVETEELWRNTNGYTTSATVNGPWAKSSPSDGMTFGCDGTLFYSGITDASIYKFGVGDRKETLFARDEQTMPWPDTFAWAPDNAMWTTSTHLDRLFGFGKASTMYILRQEADDVVKGGYQKGPDCAL